MELLLLNLWGGGGDWHGCRGVAYIYLISIFNLIFKNIFNTLTQSRPHPPATNNLRTAQGRTTHTMIAVYASGVLNAFPDAVAKQCHVKAKKQQSIKVYTCLDWREEKSHVAVAVSVLLAHCSHWWQNSRVWMEPSCDHHLQAILAWLFFWHQSATIVSTYVQMNRRKRGNSP